MAERPKFEYLYEQLVKARRYDEAAKELIQGGQPLHAYKAGQAIANAYEHLRNATELGEGNITKQRAIRRFYKRALFITRNNNPEKVGEELVIELILGGYIQENKLGDNAQKEIAKLVEDHAEIYRKLREAKISQKQAKNWILAVLSVRTFNLLFPHMKDMAVAAFTYQYFLDELPREKFAENEKESAMYSDALYVAVHQALLQSDIDTVRNDLLQVHGLDGSDIHEYIRWNNYAKELYASRLTLRLKRAVSRNGAPFRILRSLARSNPPTEMVLYRDSFLQLYRTQIDREMVRVNRRLDSGVIKSIIFLFLTKVIVGLAIEVPFDHLIYGYVVLLPLIINLLFPPLYMASLRLGIVLPSADNTLLLTDFMDQLLYGDQAPKPKLPKNPSRSINARLAYSLLFFVPFTITFFILAAIHFNPLQMAIFIVFFSTASFLGYRLGHMVQELRMASGEFGAISLLMDLFYLPYIQLGQWLAARYAQVNVVGEVLDLFIELPLKTFLSLIRQWVYFLREKHEELY